MSLISKPNTFAAGGVIQAAEHNANFDTIYNDHNGNITNANIAASASIDASKLNLATIAQSITMTSQPINFAQGTDVASASTTDIGAVTGNFIDITGTTTITALGTSQAGTFRIVRFEDALTLTHNASSLILPTAANITTVANDTAGFVSLGAGDWKCVWYQRYDGTALTGATASNALSGSVIQTVNSITTAYSTGTTAMVLDDSIPQNTEGNQYMTQAITPNNASNKLIITIVSSFGYTAGGGAGAIALFQDSTANALAAWSFVNSNSDTHTYTQTFYMTAGTTSSTTFKVRIGGTSGKTIYFNGNPTLSGRIFGGVSSSSLTIQEIKA